MTDPVLWMEVPFLAAVGALDNPDIWATFGIRWPDLLAGLAGGTVNAFLSKRSEPSAILSSMIVGALTANYLSETFASYLGLTKTGVAGFVIGVAGTTIGQGIIEMSRSWRPFGPTNGKAKGGNDARPSS